MKNIRIRKFIKTDDATGLTAYKWAIRLETRILHYTKSIKRCRVLYRKYLFFMEKSANLGYPEAQYRMGMAYYKEYTLGFNNPDADEERELYWFSKACDNDVSGACNSLAITYERMGLINSAVTAYNKAITLGEEDAGTNLATLIADATKIHKKEMNLGDDHTPEDRLSFVIDAIETYNNKMAAGDGNIDEMLSALDLELYGTVDKLRAIATPKGFAEYWNKHNPDNKMPVPKL